MSIDPQTGAMPKESRAPPLKSPGRRGPSKGAFARLSRLLTDSTQVDATRVCWDALLSLKSAPRVASWPMIFSPYGQTPVAHLARESGMSQARSRHFAEDWIARVQGSLILYAANADCTPFERTMMSLLDLAKEQA